MHYSLTLFDLVVLAGMGQGVIYVIAICFSRQKAADRTLLAMLLLTLVLLSFKILLHTMGFWEYPAFRYFPLAIDCLVQPLIYLYACSLTSKAFRFRSKMLNHFILPGLFMLHAIVVYVKTMGQQGNVLKDAVAQGLWYNPVKRAEDIAALLTAMIYWFMAFKRIGVYRRWLFESQSDTAIPELLWLKNLLVVTGLLVFSLALSSLPQNILGVRSFSFIYTQVFYLYLAFLTCFLAFKGYWLETWAGRQRTLSENKMSIEAAIKPPSKDVPYASIQAAIKKALEEQKVYLDPELNLQQLAAVIAYPVAQVSATVNQYFAQNFRNLINGYRVNEVKERLKNPAYANLTLMGIALDCGFNSEASFYRIFRQHYGDSPKNYMKSFQKDF
eukprot:gene11825-13786_t